MITKKEAAELIYAGVLGCLDRADQTKLNEYLTAGGELPSNLGEFQNIAALLPIILQAETPDPKLKDKVARKLYRIKDEIRAKAATDKNNVSPAEIFYNNSRENRKSSSTLENKLSTTEPEKLIITESDQETGAGEEQPPVPSETPESKDTAAKQNSGEIDNKDFEPVTPSRNTFESYKSTREKVLEGNFEDVPEEKQEEEIKPEEKVPAKDKVKTYERVVTKERPTYRTSRETPYMKTSTRERGKSFEKAYKRRYVTEETSSKNKGIAFWLTISLFTVLLLALLVFYLNFSSEITDLKFTNDTLRQQVNDLSVKFNSTQEIQNILESSDVEVVNLEGTGINPGGKGKIILSVSQNKGYLQLSDMPTLGRSSAYQLWVQMPDGRYFSLGVFTPSGRVQYFPFKIPQSLENNVSEFLVTEESSNGAVQPGNKVFLSGSLR
jgi:hypothetical protein